MLVCNPLGRVIQCLRTTTTTTTTMANFINWFLISPSNFGGVKRSGTTPRNIRRFAPNCTPRTGMSVKRVSKPSTCGCKLEWLGEFMKFGGGYAIPSPPTISAVRRWRRRQRQILYLRGLGRRWME